MITNPIQAGEFLFVCQFVSQQSSLTIVHCKLLLTNCEIHLALKSTSSNEKGRQLTDDDHNGPLALIRGSDVIVQSTQPAVLAAAFLGVGVQTVVLSRVGPGVVGQEGACSRATRLVIEVGVVATALWE